MGSPPNCKEHGKKFWRIVHYKHNHSAFNGYHRTYSEWSSIICVAPGCLASWRTEAAYVEKLEYLKAGEHHHWSTLEACI